MGMDALTDGLNDAIIQFQKKIGAYDKDLWEEYMEEEELQEFGKNTNAPLKTGRLKTELIDVDLFRGSNFTKAKPEYAWIAITRRGITRVIFFPFCYKWWILNISTRLFGVLLVLYTMQIVSMIIFFSDLVSAGDETFTLVEVFSPVILMLILGTTYCQVVSTKVSKIRHLQRKSSRRKFKLNYKKRQHMQKTEKVQGCSNNQVIDRSTLSGVRRRLIPQGCTTNSEKISGERVNMSSMVTSQSTFIMTDGTVYLQKTDEDVNGRSNEHSQCLNTPVELMEPAGHIILASCNELEEHLQNCYDPSSNHRDSTMAIPSCQSIKERFSYVTGSCEDEQTKIDDVIMPDSIAAVISDYNNLEDKASLESKPNTTNKHEEYKEVLGPKFTTQSDVDDLSWIDKGDDGSSPSSSETSESSESDDDSEVEEPQVVDDNFPKHENPFCSSMTSIPVLINNSYTSSDKEKVGVRLFMGNECKKTEMSVIEISCAINRKVDSTNINTDYLRIGILFAALIAIVPVCYRLHMTQTKDVNLSLLGSDWLFNIHRAMFGSEWLIQIITITALVERFSLSLMFFFMLAVTERTYKQRCLFAKFFTHLTSARRARKSGLPHFRLDRVSSIKAWLSLRSFLKKRGPQRSVDVIVTSTFLVTLVLISFLCVELLCDADRLHSELHNYDVVIWSFCLSLYLLRFVTLGSEINKKFRNSSLLLTEQINLYLRMERKPRKKDDLMLANNVLKLASKLLKELESPFKISGLSMNPMLYNIIRVVVLSAFSAVLSEILGFKLKLWKIKT